MSSTPSTSTANTGSSANTTSPPAARSPATTSNTSAPTAASASTSASNQQTQRAPHYRPAPTSTSASIPSPPAVIKDFALNFYTGKSHGTIKLYPQGEPTYERVRADLRHWLLTDPPILKNLLSQLNHRSAHYAWGGRSHAFLLLRVDLPLVGKKISFRDQRKRPAEGLCPQRSCRSARSGPVRQDNRTC